MRDKELSYWTCRGEETAGFFVAEVDGEIAGTVCYVIEEDGEMEMFRMSADKKFRRRGVGGQLLLKIEETARRLKINKVRFNTSTAQEPAVALYTKKGYNLVRKLKISLNQIVIFSFVGSDRKLHANNRSGSTSPFQQKNRILSHSCRFYIDVVVVMMTWTH